jgi:uncharacterized membrane protein
VKPPSSFTRHTSFSFVVLLTAAVTATSTYQSLERYQDLRSGWSWDLAYYNQWFWALTQGDGKVTVRPLSAYAQEGPSVWKMNYLSPIRLAIVPFYMIKPDPRTLIVIQNVLFWWIIPAAYGLVRSESSSDAAAASAAALVPATPLLWPLVWNDFRELQLAGPFVLWAVQGVRSRSTGLATLGIAGMLACRQEFAVVLATFALLPAREAEPLDRTLRWRRATLLIGLAWLLLGFFAYLKFAVGGGAPNAFINQFLGPKATLLQTTGTAAEALLLGLGGWALLACLAPRVALLSLPWIWGLCSGRWAMRFLETQDWHHARYAVPMVLLVLAAGLIGYARLASWLLPRPGGRAGMAVIWTITALVCLFGLRDVTRRMSKIPPPVEKAEADQIWSSIRRVGPNDAVLADYALAAPLSSRRSLYSYVMIPNLPPGFPNLTPDFRWLFIRNDFVFLNPLLEQGFDVVFRGKTFTVAHRQPPSPTSSPSP